MAIGPRRRRRRVSRKEAVGTNVKALTGVVPHLAPETLHALIRHRGLDASGDLVGAATTAQLTVIFDMDLWRRNRSGRDEQFDEERFGEWIEALVESGDLFAVQTVAAMDEDMVIAGLSCYVRVIDPATLVSPNGDDEPVDIAVPLASGLSREVGGYVVRARRDDAWDAIVALLFALAEHHPDRFNSVMRGCRALSNSTPEIDGLDELLTDPEQSGDLRVHLHREPRSEGARLRGTADRALDALNRARSEAGIGLLRGATAIV